MIAILNLEKPRYNYKTKHKRCKMEELKVQENQERLAANVLQKLGGVTHDTLEQQWTSLKTAVSRGTEEVIGIKETYQGRNKSTLWWAEDLRNAVKLKMKYFRKWLKSRTFEDRANDVLARNNVNRMKIRSKQGVYENTGNDLW